MEVAGHIGGLESERPPELRTCAIEGAPRRQHSNNCVGMPVLKDLAADDIGIHPELVAPEHAADHDDFLLAELILTRKEQAALCGFHPENVEEMNANSCTAQLNRFAGTGEHGPAAGLRSHVFEHMVLVFPIQVVE